MSKVPDSFINWFRFAAPYIQKHRGSTFVLGISSDALNHPDFINLVHDIALLQSLGIRLVIVQGARTQINQRLQTAGIQAPIAEGVRVTPPEAIAQVVAAANAVKTDLESAMSSGQIGSPMFQLNLRTLSGNFISARPYGIRNGVDYELTGLVRQVDKQAIENALDSGAAVIMNTLGYASTGDVFNLSLGNCIQAVATSLKADKVIACLPSSYLDDAQRGAVLAPTAALNQTQDAEDDASLVVALIESVEKGVERAHLVSYEENGALLRELFTHDGSGLLISNQAFSKVRQAELGDISGIMELIQPLQDDGTLVHRNRDLLEQQLNHFSVMDVDGMVAGCGALIPLGEGSAEVACLAVHSEFQRRGFAADILAYLESQADDAGHKRLFALTTLTDHWFGEQGYKLSSVDDLPEERAKEYNRNRNSKVLLKPL